MRQRAKWRGMARPDGGRPRFAQHPAYSGVVKILSGRVDWQTCQVSICMTVGEARMRRRMRRRDFRHLMSSSIGRRLVEWPSSTDSRGSPRTDRIPPHTFLNRALIHGAFEPWRLAKINLADIHERILSIVGRCCSQIVEFCHSPRVSESRMVQIS
jgi:hypothetical protein